MYASAIVSLDTLDVPNDFRNRTALTLDALLKAHLGICRTLDPHHDPLKAHLAGQTGYMQYLSQREQTSEHLKALLAQLELSIPYPSGYTPKILMEGGGIKKSLWQQLCKRAGIIIKRGDSNRYFTNRELRTKLIPAALDHNTPKSKAAAKLWQEMLDEDKRES